MEIDYTALSFTVPQKVRFRYKLEGRDADWVDSGTRRQAFYTDLRPGTYRFHVIACNNDGIWNEEGAHVDFGMARAWYQTNWFRLLCIATGIFAVWSLYQLRLRQCLRQVAALYQERMEAQLAERERIARDLHDTLLQSFEGVLLRFQRASNLLLTRPDEAKKKLDYTRMKSRVRDRMRALPASPRAAILRLFGTLLYRRSYGPLLNPF